MGSKIWQTASDARKLDAICRARATDNAYLFKPVPKNITINPTDPHSVDVAKKLLQNSNKELELLTVLELSLDSWRDYNREIKAFVQNGFKSGLSPQINNFQVLNSSQKISDANMHNVFRALKYSLTGNNKTVSETYDAAERAKDKIASEGMAVTSHIVAVAESNIVKVAYALGLLQIKRQELEILTSDLSWNLKGL